MNKLKSPVAVVLLSLLTGVGTGLGWFWQAGQILAADMQEQHLANIEASRPAEPWDFWTVELENLSREVKDHRTRLVKWESELNEREAQLDQERAEIETTRRQVSVLQEQINDQIVAVQSQEVRNLKSLASTYSLLTPRAAVAIFDQMDDITVAKLLSLMKPEAASKILEELSRDGEGNELRVKRAAALSQRLRLLVPVEFS